ncbi:MAG: hypothetical protein FWE89_03750, partial [Syntrophaceae bacterium]|nr:hypothetical protein [Syntrophaceae bacterium]
MRFRDTIAAIATPPGAGGIGVIRISGPQAAAISRRIFRPSRSGTSLSPRRLCHGTIIRPETGQVLDEALAVFFQAPHSYTGEDTVEISCHGGIHIANAVLGSVINAGARLALPGEFTKTAYLNNKISLTGAEAVGRLISAVNETGAMVASAQSRGGLSKKIR